MPTLGPIASFLPRSPIASLLRMKRNRLEAGPGLEGPRRSRREPASSPLSTPDDDGRSWDRPGLYERVRVRIRTRHLSPRTEATYLGWIRRYIAHFGGMHPATLGRADVEAFIEQLAEGQGLGPGSQNQAASAIVFLYRELFGIDLGGRKGVSRAQGNKVLPKYASAEEVDLVLGRLKEPYRVAAMIMYGSGTRVSETIGLRIKDVSLGSGELHVRAGKGAKDRTTVIPRSAMPALRRQIQRVEEAHLEDLEAGRGWARLPAALHRKDPRAGWEFGWQFLFPSPKLTRDPKTRHVGRAPIHVTTVQRAIKQAARAAKIHRPVSCHVLRHCFATEMLRAGCDIRLLQRLMGHRDLKTTSRYLHIINRPGLNVISPLDRLPSFKATLERELATPEGAGTG